MINISSVSISDKRSLPFKTTWECQSKSRKKKEFVNAATFFENIQFSVNERYSESNEHINLDVEKERYSSCERCGDKLQFSQYGDNSGGLCSVCENEMFMSFEMYGSLKDYIKDIKSKFFKSQHIYLKDGKHLDTWYRFNKKIDYSKFNW